MHSDAGRAPLALNELGFGTVAIGMVDIFPSLQSCQGYGIAWGEINRRINERAENIVGECCLTLLFRLIHSWTGQQVMGTQYPLTPVI